MVGEILADFSHDPLFHVGMKGPAQVGKRARWRGDDEGRDRAAAHHALERSGDAFDKTVLLEVMPVGLIDAATPMRAAAPKGRARLVGALLMGRRILIGENLLGPNGRRTAAYSAAARVCPSRRLSVSRSASAASAITVPGGKIASAQ